MTHRTRVDAALVGYRPVDPPTLRDRLVELEAELHKEVAQLDVDIRRAEVREFHELVKRLCHWRARRTFGLRAVDTPLF